MKCSKLNHTCWWMVRPLHFVYEGGFLDFSTIDCHLLSEIQFSPYADTCKFWKEVSLLNHPLLEGKKILTPQSIKGKKDISLIFLFSFFFFFPFFYQKPRILFKDQIMGIKCGLRSSSIKFGEPSSLKSSKPLLGGDANPSIEEQWCWVLRL